MSPESDKLQEGSGPLTDDEMRKAIDKRFNEVAATAILFASVVLIVSSVGCYLRCCCRYHTCRTWSLYLVSSLSLPRKRYKIRGSQKDFLGYSRAAWHCARITKQSGLGYRLEVGLRERFEQRATLIVDNLDLPTSKDEVLDAAKEILKLDDPYVQWPEVPGLSHTIPSLQQMAEVEALRGLQKGLADEKLFFTLLLQRRDFNLRGSVD